MSRDMDNWVRDVDGSILLPETDEQRHRRIVDDVLRWLSVVIVIICWAKGC